MASDSHDYQMYSPDEGRAVVIGLSQAHHKGDTSLVYCLEVLENREQLNRPGLNGTLLLSQPKNPDLCTLKNWL